MNLQTAIALRSSLDRLIGKQTLVKGVYEVNETLTLHVSGTVSKAVDTDKKPAMPIRQALAYLLETDPEFVKVFEKALVRAQSEKDGDATILTSNIIKKGITQLEIVEEKVINKLGVERSPVAGATKAETELEELTQPEVCGTL